MALTMLSILTLLLSFVPLVMPLHETNNGKSADSSTLYMLAASVSGPKAVNILKSVYKQFAQVHPAVIARYNTKNPPVGAVVSRETYSDLGSRGKGDVNCFPISVWDWTRAKGREAATSGPLVVHASAVTGMLPFGTIMLFSQLAPISAATDKT
ncbi:uncharacterized protein PAC_12732 [Phialocephala subalpina]|uniref:Uncharacterized protein n=1 Tax=Phialocephala subalpina TaxID=576137 RepID=A0A1L7XCT5_9HELO|nr:uncharacterized protein PAC_12732 [Phialocephala subalpina]